MKYIMYVVQYKCYNLGNCFQTKVFLAVIKRDASYNNYPEAKIMP